MFEADGFEGTARIGVAQGEFEVVFVFTDEALFEDFEGTGEEWGGEELAPGVLCEEKNVV